LPTYKPRGRLSLGQDHENPGSVGVVEKVLWPEARWGVITGRESYDWPPDDKGESNRPKDIGEHLTFERGAVMPRHGQADRDYLFLQPHLPPS
jgi:hypothetical protein